ncbi:hypothetical protein EGW08_016888, partial [Elysia chlorotica]
MALSQMHVFVLILFLICDVPCGSGFSKITQKLEKDLKKAQNLLESHNCSHTVDDCGNRFIPDKPRCSDFERTGKCMLNECLGIKGTGDEKTVAAILTKYINAIDYC